jgi:hypothetical protein
MRATISTALTTAAAAVLLIISTGCRADSSDSVPTGADLIGTWAQNGVGYEQGEPVTWEDQTVVIESADGQGFTGYKEYTREGGTPQQETVNGVVGADGEIIMADEDGFFRGRLDNGAIIGQYVEVGADHTAMNIELTRT